MDVASIMSIIGTTLMYSSPLAFAALGGVISERSGVINLGIEGMMTVGAFTGTAVSYFTGNPWLGVLMAGLAGTAMALLHAIASITFKADQTVSGIALNLIGPGLALFMAKLMFEGSSTTKSAPTLPTLFGSFLSGDSPFYGLNINITVVLALVLAILMWFVLYKTKWGLRVRAVGEHPAAADTLGVNVSKVRYVCVLLSGFLAGIGGSAVTLAIVSQFTPTAISGQGFIALAALIFGKWTPHGTYGACLLFGFAQAMVVFLGGGNFAIPSQILAMLPYVLTLIVLMVFVGRSVAPKADGKPYEKGKR